MPEVGTESKSPKATTRRLKPGEIPANHSNTPRQVHFDNSGTTNGATTKGSSTTNSSKAKPPETEKNTQPETHPQVGLPPSSAPGHNTGGPWFTSADPSRSVNLPGQPSIFTAGAPPTPQQQQQHAPFLPGYPYFPQFLHQQGQATPQQSFIPVTYIGNHSQTPPTVPMGDYQNCVPPPTGINFQPPVPDTTFGPIPHVYVPRFDGGYTAVPGAHVCHPPAASFSYRVPASSSTQYFAAPACPATMTVVTPKTFYVNGFTYYQPAVNAVPYGQPGYVVQQPGLVPQSSPVVFNGQTYIPAATSAAGQPMFATPIMTAGGVAAGPPGAAGLATATAMGSGPVPVIAGNCANPPPPDVSGLGRTPNEEMLRQVEFAYSNRLFEPQDFKPADDDPSRFYYVREVDGNWTQRNRFTIDHMGDCRWYVTDEGWFYAVRLPD